MLKSCFVSIKIILLCHIYKKLKEMEEFWASLTVLEKILWSIAIPSSFIFIIQTIMTFAGMDSHDGVGAEFNGNEGDSSPFQLFSFRNLINFLLGFSWAGISLYGNIESETWIIILSTFGGVLLVAVVLLIFYYMSRLGESGNIHSKDTIGKTAVVYVPISEKRSRAGKIQLSINGVICEFDALTDGDSLRTGEPVVVKSVINGNLLLVSKV
jgi:membrane protein implicated in regulation of membrane protease activity